MQLLYSRAVLFFYGECNLEHNQAANGGAILATESKLNVNGDVTIVHNDATRNGGGVYLLTSELNCLQDRIFALHGNSADNRGGGFHAVSSSIKATYYVKYYYYPMASYLGTKIIQHSEIWRWIIAGSQCKTQYPEVWCLNIYH